MNKLFDYWRRLSLRVIFLFITAMLVSFFPAALRNFFGDIQVISDHSLIDDNWNWGFRHYLYWWMCVILFIIQAIRIIHWMMSNVDEFKP